VQKGGALETDVNESRLHARQDAAYAAFINVADQATAVGAFDEGLLQHAVLDHGYPGFTGRDVDEQLGTQAMVPFPYPGAPLCHVGRRPNVKSKRYKKVPLTTGF
jgi:hypothetical protein